MSVEKVATGSKGRKRGAKRSKTAAPAAEAADTKSPFDEFYEELKPCVKELMDSATQNQLKKIGDILQRCRGHKRLERKKARPVKDKPLQQGGNFFCFAHDPKTMAEYNEYIASLSADAERPTILDFAKGDYWKNKKAAWLSEKTQEAGALSDAE